MTTELDRAFAALADPARRRAVRLLARRPRRSSDLAQALGLARPAMSKHLRALREAGLVRERGSDEDARVRIYEVRPRALDAMRTWVDEVEAFWQDQLASFKAHAEARQGKKRGTR